MTAIRVFYEDQAAGPIKNFGPHRLLCACVADRTGKKLWEVAAKVDGQPKKGDSKLLKACQKHASVDRDEVIFAVFDADKVHRIVHKSGDAKAEELLRELQAQINSPKVRPFLLQRKIETVVEATVECLGDVRDGPIPKRHNERDRFLNRAANHPSRSVRDCINNRVPSFAALVEAVADTLAATA